MSQASSDNAISRRLSNLYIPNFNIDEKTRAEIDSNVNDILSNLSKNQSCASAYDRLMQRVWKDVVAPSAWKNLKTPEAEELKTSRGNEYQNSLLSSIFDEVMKKGLVSTFLSTRARTHQPERTILTSMLDLSSLLVRTIPRNGLMIWPNLLSSMGLSLEHEWPLWDSQLVHPPPDWQGILYQRS